MSVCVSSSLSSGMTHASHLHLTSTLSMMQSFQNHHPMAPSIGNSLDMPHAQTPSQQHQLQNSSSSSSSDVNEPNSEMLLSLIARNKTLEGESILAGAISFVVDRFAVGKMLRDRKKSGKYFENSCLRRVVIRDETAKNMTRFRPQQKKVICCLKYSLSPDRTCVAKCARRFRSGDNQMISSTEFGVVYSDVVRYCDVNLRYSTELTL